MVEMRIGSSGPLRLAEVECHSCSGRATLSDPSCRECVILPLLAREVDGVVLKRPYHRLYPFLSPFLRELRSLPSERPGALTSFLRTLEVPKRHTSLEGRYRLLLSLWKEGSREVLRPFFADCFILPFRGKGEVVEAYPLGEGRVRIYRREDSPLPFYELELPEFHLPEEEMELLEEVFLEEPAPTEDLREGWRRALREKGRHTAEELERLSSLLHSWTSYGVLEALSRDEHLTDFLFPSPPELQPVRVIHERWDLCETGIHCSTPFLLSLAERLASRVGTSFDEVRPQLDAEIEELGLRVFLARDPALWGKGVGMAVRKRRGRTWTQPLFLQRGSLTPLASSFLSWAVREGASAFIIGEVGSAKTSLLESLLPEVGREHHLICFQDTPELHVEELVRCGYSVENVRIGRPEELERQIEAFLRGGPAHWFIAEVRSQEAVRAALGAAARRGSQPVVSSFHARSKREMYELICHILGLPPAVYKHVDLVVVTARFRGREGTVRRVVEISEVRKEWREEPEYSELFSYDRRKDLLSPLSLLDGRPPSPGEVRKAVKRLRFRPPEEGGSELVPFVCRREGKEEEEVLEEILWESLVKAKLVELSKENPSLVELEGVTRSYGRYLSLVRERGVGEETFREWLRWLKR